MEYLWLVIILFLVVIEICTADLVTIWFIASAIIALIMSFLLDNIVIQFFAFVAIGILLMLVTKPLMKKTKLKSNVKTNLDRIIGMNAYVTEDIPKNGIGEVKVDGKKWSAYADYKIEKGSVVKVIEMTSVKLKVEKESE